MEIKSFNEIVSSQQSDNNNAIIAKNKSLLCFVKLLYRIVNLAAIWKHYVNYEPLQVS